MLDIQREKGCQVEERLGRRYGSGQVIFIPCDVTSKCQLKGKENNINYFTGHNYFNYYLSICSKNM